MAVNHVQLLVASSGLIKIEQASEHSFKLMRHGSVDSYLAHLSISELRDLFDVVGDLITFLDTAQPDADAS